jgi:hypothetical protein
MIEGVGEIFRVLFGIALAAALFYFRFRHYHRPKDLGDGGIQKLGLHEHEN